jgi:hypothetical protein
VIGLEAERGIFARRLLVLRLRSGRRGAVRSRGDLSLGGPRGRPAIAAVEGYVVAGVGDRPAVGVGDTDIAEVIDGSVIDEVLPCHMPPWYPEPL